MPERKLNQNQLALYFEICGIEKFKAHVWAFEGSGSCNGHEKPVYDLLFARFWDWPGSQC